MKKLGITAALLAFALAGISWAQSSKEHVVQDDAALREAIASAKPGSRILIAPGRYRTPLRFNAQNSGTKDAPITLAAQGGLGSVVIDGAGTPIVIKFSGTSYVRLEGLEITGGGYHGVFFEKGAHHITLKGNRVYDNHAIRPMNSHAEVKGSGRRDLRPHHITIANNEIFHTTHPPGGNFQGIDCNFCSDFHIADNYLHDIGQPTAEPHSHYDRGSCIQMKSMSERTVIEGNRFTRCHIGIVYGGEGMASPEHVGGIVRDNVVTESGEIGIAVVNVRGGKVHLNKLSANPHSIVIARDVRNPKAQNQVDITSNITGTPIESVGDKGITLRDNAVVSIPKSE